MLWRGNNVAAARSGSDTLTKRISSALCDIRVLKEKHVPVDTDDTTGMYFRLDTAYDVSFYLFINIKLSTSNLIGKTDEAKDLDGY